MRECKRCERHLPHSSFPDPTKKQRWLDHCIDCTTARRRAYTATRKLSRCISCANDRPEHMFKLRDGMVSNQCVKCRVAEEKKIAESLADIQYDYKWARFMGHDHWSAIAWVAKGYGLNYKTLRGILIDMQTQPISWEPDDFTSAGRKWCPRCGVEQDLEDFYLYRPKKQKPYYSSCCIDCERERARQRWRKNNAVKKPSRRKVRL